MEPKLPIDEQLEKDILGCCFVQDPALLLAARAVLAPEDFSLTDHQRIYRSICRIVDSGGAASWNAVALDMKARNEPIELGYLVEMNANGAEIVLDRLLSRAKDLSRRRTLALRSYQLAHEASDITVPLDEIAQRAQANLREIYGATDAQDGPEDAGAIIDHVGGIGEFLKPQRGILSPWPEVDQVTGGWQDGDLVLIGARPSMGKTALALEIVRHSAERGTPSVFYSYEMTRESIVMRLISRRTGIPFLDIRQGELNSSERRAVRDAVEALAAMPLKIVGASGKTVLGIRVHAERLYHQGKCKLAAVDYIGLIRGMGRQQSRNHELGEICAQLKEIAANLKIPMIVLSQLSRAPEGRTDKRPIMSDLRDSGDLESHADMITFLHRPGYYNREDPSLRLVAELIISKQRNGDTPIIPLEFYRECGRFESVRQPEAA